MSTSALVIAIIVAIAVIVVAFLIIRVQRSQKLKARFGPEYQRAVEESGGRLRAEAKLANLEKRVKGYEIKPLSPEARTNFVMNWHKVQSRFVDDPRGALAEADKLIRSIMAARGYPVTDFEQQAADISVDHPLVVENYRAGHEISLRHAEGRASTEDMRQAMIHYRTLFTELAEEPEPVRTMTGRAARA